MTAKEVFEHLATLTDKLLIATDRLCRDVSVLNARIIADADERESYTEPTPVPKKKFNITDVLNDFERCQRNILNAEHEVSAIRARIDDIAANEAAREDMRRYLKRKDE